MLVNFTNVQISIEAAGPRKAYTKLCKMLKGAADYNTLDAQYEVIDKTVLVEGADVSELWNNGCEPCEGSGFVHISFDGMFEIGEIQACDDCNAFDSDEAARAAHDRQHLNCTWKLDHEEVIEEREQPA